MPRDVLTFKGWHLTCKMCSNANHGKGTYEPQLKLEKKQKPMKMKGGVGNHYMAICIWLVL